MRSPFEALSDSEVDDSWHYRDHDSLADFSQHDSEDPTGDDDLMELRTDPYVFASLSPSEFWVVNRRYGLDGESESMKDIARDLGVTHSEARDILGTALNKMRDNFNATA